MVLPRQELAHDQMTGNSARNTACCLVPCSTLYCFIRLIVTPSKKSFDRNTQYHILFLITLQTYFLNVLFWPYIITFLFLKGLKYFSCTVFLLHQMVTNFLPPHTHVCRQYYKSFNFYLKCFKINLVFKIK